MAITQKVSNQPVNAVLLIAMVVEGESAEAGDVVELSARDFKYLHTYNRVLPATKENVAAVKAEVAAQKEAARKNAAATDELTATKSALAIALAELEKLKKAR
jgi:hypothetical protein